MTITTISGAISGQQWNRFFTKTIANNVIDRPASYWKSVGNPGAGAFDTTLNGVTLTAPQTGQIDFSNPASGNTYLARLQAMVPAAGFLYLYDRLWHNGGFDVTSILAQNIVSPTWPARDVDGATAGNGVFLALEISAAVTGAVSPVITISYTNTAGTSGRTATNLDATASAPAVGAFYRIGLQAGDTGVKSVESLTLDIGWTTGTMNLVAYRPIAVIELIGGGIRNAIDAITGGFPRMYDGSVPFFVIVPSATGAMGLSGQIIYAQG